MNIDFFEQAPQPRERVKIERAEINPYPDGWRIKLNVEVTPFQERPSLEVTLAKGDQPIADLCVIETMHAKMEFTLHVRGVASPKGDYTLTIDLYYDDRNMPQDRRVESFSIV